MLTTEDHDNMAAFEAQVDAVSALLAEEIAEIGAGRLEAVGDYHDSKADLLKRIELKLPVIEPFLSAAVETRPELREKIQRLRALVQQESALLDRMVEAMTAIVDEIARIRDRHSLNGLYEKSGRRLADNVATRVRIDKDL